MAGNYGIDGHKLHLHPRQVADWLDGKSIAPIYIEVSPSGGCNHNCRFCGMDFARQPERRLPAKLFQQRLQEMGAAGVKSIMYCGEGEPFLHEEMGEIAVATKQAGIDVAFTTNGTLLLPRVAEMVVPVASWIKISWSAATAKTYAYLHGTHEEDFAAVVANLAAAVKIREKTASACTLGVQMLLLPENAGEAVQLAALVRDLGADYFVVKPYSQHPQSHTVEYADIRYDSHAGLAEQLKALQTPAFSVIFREEALERWTGQAKAYDHCRALPFGGWYIDSAGGVWGCLAFIGDDRFYYGNMLEVPFDQLLRSDLCRRKIADCVESLDVGQCRINCRMDAINGYLHTLKKPGSHVNFI